MYDLVPIAAEDYGDMTASFKVVAAARKRDLYMTLFNLKSKWTLNATLTAILSWNSSHPFVICFQLAFWSFVCVFRILPVIIIPDVCKTNLVCVKKDLNC